MLRVMIPCLLGVFLALEVRAAEPIKVAKDTTYLVEPLKGDGRVDYCAALNARMSKGVTPESNAAVALWQICGPGIGQQKNLTKYFELLGIEPPPTKGRYFLDFTDWLKSKNTPEGDFKKLYKQQEDAFSKPWADAQYPEVAAWLKDVGEPLDQWVEATKRPHFYSPLVGEQVFAGATAHYFGTPIREFSRALVARAMRRMQAGDLEAAWKDLAACLRMGGLLLKGPSSADRSLGGAMQIFACQGIRIMACHFKVPAALRKRCQQELEDAPRERLTEICALYERCGGLDLIQTFAKQPSDDKTWQQLLPSTAKFHDPQYAVDWNEAAREANRLLDQRFLLLQRGTLRESAAALKKIDLEYRKQVGGQEESISFPFDDACIAYVLKGETPAERGRRLGVWCVSITVGVAVESADRMCTPAADGMQYARVVLGLAEYRREQGSYPPDLASLVPKYLDKIPISLVSGEPPAYRRVGSSYLVSAFPPQQWPENLHFTYAYDRTAYDLNVAAENVKLITADGSTIDGLFFWGKGDDKKLALLATQPTLEHASITLLAPSTPEGLLQLTNLPRLKSLSLSGPALNDSYIPSLLKIPNLYSLNLRDGKVTAGAVAQLVNLKELSYVELENLRLTDAVVPHLLKISRLENLNLAGNEITDQGVAQLAAVVRLESLNLSRTKVTDAGLVPLTKLPRLTTIRLDNTKITDRGLATLQEMKQLSSLWLQDVKVSEAALEAFKKALPDCSVWRN